MSASTIRGSVVVFLEESFGLEPGDVGDDDPLFSSGILDSFSMVQLVMFVEEAAGVRLNPDDITLDNFDTIASITQFAQAASGG